MKTGTARSHTHTHTNHIHTLTHTYRGSFSSTDYSIEDRRGTLTHTQTLSLSSGEVRCSTHSTPTLSSLYSVSSLSIFYRSLSPLSSHATKRKWEDPGCTEAGFDSERRDSRGCKPKSHTAKDKQRRERQRRSYARRKNGIQSKRGRPPSQNCTFPQERKRTRRRVHAQEKTEVLSVVAQFQGSTSPSDFNEVVKKAVSTCDTKFGKKTFPVLHALVSKDTMNEKLSSAALSCARVLRARTRETLLVSSLVDSMEMKKKSSHPGATVQRNI